MVGQKKNGMNQKIDANELVIKNIHNYLKKKKIDYKDFIAELYKLVPKEKVDYSPIYHFITKVDLIVFYWNINFFHYEKAFLRFLI